MGRDDLHRRKEQMPEIQNQHQPYDRSSKWLIQHHGDSMLWLARVRNIRAWRAAQAEVVQPRRLPDGLLEVRLEDETGDDLFLLEVATYPQRRVGRLNGAGNPSNSTHRPAKRPIYWPSPKCSPFCGIMT